ncbi:sin3 associated polypeptide p18-like protein, putative, partial [Plasmodium sp. DRC-Itaito]
EKYYSRKKKKRDTNESSYSISLSSYEDFKRRKHKTKKDKDSGKDSDYYYDDEGHIKEHTEESLKEKKKKNKEKKRTWKNEKHEDTSKDFFYNKERTHSLEGTEDEKNSYFSREISEDFFASNSRNRSRVSSSDSYYKIKKHECKDRKKRKCDEENLLLRTKKKRKRRDNYYTDDNYVSDNTYSSMYRNKNYITNRKNDGVNNRTNNHTTYRNNDHINYHRRSTYREDISIEYYDKKDLEKEKYIKRYNENEKYRNNDFISKYDINKKRKSSPNYGISSKYNNYKRSSYINNISINTHSRYSNPHINGIDKIGIINREKTCPFLLRLFYKVDKEYNVDDMDILLTKDNNSNELQIYAWIDITMREIVTLVKDFYKDSRQRNAQWVFKVFSYEKKKLTFLSKVHSTIYNYKEDNKTLLSLNYEIGDIILLSIMLDRK